MKLVDFIKSVETLAPPELAMDFDNVGLLVGPDHEEIRNVLVALDCTVATTREAVDTGADLLLTHHPVFFHGIKRFLPDDPETAAAYILARNGIGMMAAHTNLDAAVGGVNDALSEALGVLDTVPMELEPLSRVGRLAKAVSLDEFASFTATKLDAAVRVCGDGSKPVSRIALIGGAGGFGVNAAKECGADVLVTGECKHHEALQAASLGLCVIEAGHYETERVVLSPLIKRLQELAPGVQYNLTRCEVPCLRKL